MTADAPPSQRSLIALVAAVAASTTGYLAAFTASSLAALDISGTATLAGLPGAVATVGTALGAGTLASLAVRRGWAPSLSIGLAAATGAAVLAVVAVGAGSLPLLLIANFGYGLGNGAAQQSRYAAADLLPDARRAWGVGLTVWGATAGAVIGPNLLGPAQALATTTEFDALSLTFLLTIVAYALSLVAMFFAGRWSGALRRPGPETRDAGPRPSLGELFRPITARIALVTLIGAQVVMTMVMAMTPLHIHGAGGDYAAVGLVLSAHTLGMFALAPLSARLVVRSGPVTVILGGMGVAVMACLIAAAAPASATAALSLAMFLVGFGWNMQFVAGSTLLAVGIVGAARMRLQGATDTIVFAGSAITAVSAGILLDTIGYAQMALLAGALLIIPAAFLLRGRAALAAPEPMISA